MTDKSVSIQIILEIKDPKSPQLRVLTIEGITQVICEKLGIDPAEGTVMLLTAAAHVASRHTAESPEAAAAILHEVLDDAIAASAGFFPDDAPETTGTMQ